MTTAEEATTGITDPRDSDVLCGRGGAALRHPGNLVYRKLVNLNKGLYTTCLKTEKLKISRSIVAAIREQNGRFLEKDANNGTWYDIGDKKAIEKTSQALREGQPKLRQQIVEMGGAPTIDPQLGFYPEQIGIGLDPAVMMPPPPQQQHHPMSPQQRHSQTFNPQDMGPPLSSQRQMNAVAAQTAAMREQEMRSMQPPLPDPARQEMHAEMFQRLSLRNLNAEDEDDDPRLHHHHQQMQQQHLHQQQQRVAARLRHPSLSSQQQRHGSADLGMIESQLSLASEFSAYVGSSSGAGSGGMTNESLMSLDVGSFRRNNGSNTNNNGNNNNLYSPYGNEGNSYFTGMNNGINYSRTSNGGVGGSSSSGQLPSNSSSMPPRDKLAGMSRRDVFATMKYTRPPSVRASSNQKLPGTSGHAGAYTQYSDGMPDIHMVESNLSLYSNLSNMTDGLATITTGNTANNSSNNNNHPNNLQHAERSEPEVQQPVVERTKVIDHSQDINWSGGRSNHSLMSGLSRIDDCASMDQSLFSDMSKKISNVSTRSVAMSEISVLELQERSNEDEDSSSHTDFAHGLEGFAAPIQARRTEYDLS